MLALAGLLLLFLVLPPSRDVRLAALYVGPLYVFIQLRSFADHAPWGVRTEYVVEMERWLTGGPIPTIWLQEHIRPDSGFIALDFFAAAFHWSWFIVPHLGAFLVYLYRRDWFLRYALLVMGTFYAGLLVYWLLPTAPPWVAAQEGVIPHLTRVMHEIGLTYGGAFYREAYDIVGNANPHGAMPSLHMGASVAVALALVRYMPRLAAGLLAYGIGMGFSLVYLGEHYVIDLIVGAALALVIFLIYEAAAFAGAHHPSRLVPALDSGAYGRARGRALQAYEGIVTRFTPLLRRRAG